MKKILFAFMLLIPLGVLAQHPKMHIKLYGGMNVSTLVYRVEDVESDILAGFQIGGGFRIKQKALFGEIDFEYLVQGITYSPREEADADIDDDLTVLLRGFEVPVLFGYVPVHEPVFGVYLYGGLVNRISMNGHIYFQDLDIKFKPRELHLHFYNLSARFGAQIDLAMFNFDMSYTIGITNSFRDRSRTNQHTIKFGLGFLF
jgi:hypothetical protein